MKSAGAEVKSGRALSPMLLTQIEAPLFRSSTIGKPYMKTFGVVLVLGLVATCLGCSKDPASTSGANGAELEYEGKPLSYWLAQINDKKMRIGRMPPRRWDSLVRKRRPLYPRHR